VLKIQYNAAKLQLKNVTAKKMTNISKKEFLFS